MSKDKRIPGQFPVIASTGQVGVHKEAKVKGPGVVIGRSGSLGGAQYITGDFWPLNTTLWVKDFKGNNPLFCHYLLKSLNLSTFNAGSGVPTLNRNHVHKLPIRIPPLTEQRTIAYILGTLDSKIKLNRRMNQVLEQIAQTIFKSWFVDFEFPNDNDRPYKSSDGKMIYSDELGKDVPDGWEVKCLGDVTKVLGGTTPSTKITEYWCNGTHSWVTPKDLSTLSTPVLLNTERKITDAGLSKIGSGLLQPNTLLMSSRAPIGYLAISEIPVAINQGFIAMPPSEDMSNLFLFFWCKTFHKIIISHANGSTFLEISKTNFRNIPLVVPHTKTMSKFEHLVRPLYKQIVTNEHQSHILVTQRDVLLPKLISGKIQVSGESQK